LIVLLLSSGNELTSNCNELLSKCNFLYIVSLPVVCVGGRYSWWWRN